MKVAASRPFQGRTSFISSMVSWRQPSPSALMMPSVTVLTAPPGAVGDPLEAARRLGFLDRLGRLGFPRLLRHQPGIDAAGPHQRAMGAALGDAPAVEHEDAVAADDAGEAMGEHQGRAPAHQPVERLLDHRLVLRIDRRERLVEQQDRRVAQQSAGDGDALALAAGELDALLADDGAIALGQARDEIMDIGGLGRRLDLFASKPPAGPCGCSPPPCRGRGRCPGSPPRSASGSAWKERLRRSWPPRVTRPCSGS